MIKIERAPKPPQLNDEVKAELTQEYRDKESPVWRQSYIHDTLYDMSNGKCAYSEVKFDDSSYMEIEHFKDKHQYPEFVVDWDNLLPSCKTCNDAKGTWDVVENPIVNPTVDNPQEHLFVKSFRFYGKDDVGKNTIDCLNLNDRTQFVESRSSDSCSIADQIELLDWESADTDRKKRNKVNKLLSIMNSCDRRNAYSAVLATYLLYELPSYHQLKEKIAADGYWSAALQAKENELREIALPEN